jgi:FixJ family two-component response regulator
MSARKRKPNTQKRELEEAKTIRAQQYAHKDKRILAMVADGVPKSHIESALRVSDRYINKVLARAAP